MYNARECAQSTFLRPPSTFLPCWNNVDTDVQHAHSTRVVNKKALIFRYRKIADRRIYGMSTATCTRTVVGHSTLDKHWPTDVSIKLSKSALKARYLLWPS